jgi:glutamyl/glutaminyl-tRNA synthetase
MKLFFDKPVKFNIENSKGIKDIDKLKLKKIVSEIESGIKALEEESKLWKHEDWEKVMRDVAKTNEIKDADSFMSLRLAIVGEPFSPPLFEMMQIIGKVECLERIAEFIKYLS